MIGETIKTAREQQKLSQRELAARAGVSRKHLSDIENGANASVDILIKLAQVLGIDQIQADSSLTLIVSGQGSHTIHVNEISERLKAIVQHAVAALGIVQPPVDEKADVGNVHRFPHVMTIRDGPVEEIPSDELEKLFSPTPFVEVPVSGYVAAGSGIEFHDPDEVALLPLDMKPRKPSEKIVRARGESMIDFGIADGDYVLVDVRTGPGKVAAKGEIVIGWLAKSGSEGMVVKRWWRGKGKVFQLLSGNPEFEPITIEPGDIWDLQAIVRRSCPPVKFPSVRDFSPVSG